MGLLDDVLGSAVPGGNAAKPLMIALGALLASGALFKRSETTPPGVAEGAAESGGLLAGLGGLLSRLEQNGQGAAVRSWVSDGPNQPISPNQVSSALGPEIVRALAQKTGLPEQDLASHLSQILPAVVDKLTPQGRMPTQSELAKRSS